jgi:hypothetical protein
MVETWKKAAPEDWRAAKEFLARRYPERWSDRPAPEGLANGMQAFQINIHIGEYAEDEDEQERQRGLELEQQKQQPAIDVTGTSAPPAKEPILH